MVTWVESDRTDNVTTSRSPVLPHREYATVFRGVVWFLGGPGTPTQESHRLRGGGIRLYNSSRGASSTAPVPSRKP